MNTDQKLELLEITQSIVEINKKLFEIAEKEQNASLLNAIENLLKAGSHINQSLRG